MVLLFIKIADKEAEEMAEPFVWQLVNVFTQQITNIYKRKLTLGRSKNVDMICLSTTASRSHAEFILSEDGSLKVKDLNVRAF